MSEARTVNDPDILAAPRAARRAARRALELGIKTGTPVWVIKDGRMVDLTQERKAKRGQALPVRRRRSS